MALGEWEKLNDYLVFGVLEITPAGVRPSISYESLERALGHLGMDRVPEESIEGGVVGSVCGCSLVLSPHPEVPYGSIAVPDVLYRMLRNKTLTSDMDYWTFSEPFYGEVVIPHPEHPAGRIHMLTMPSLNLRAYIEMRALEERDHSRA